MTQLQDSTAHGIRETEAGLEVLDITKIGTLTLFNNTQQILWTEVYVDGFFKAFFKIEAAGTAHLFLSCLPSHRRLENDPGVIYTYNPWAWKKIRVIFVEANGQKTEQNFQVRYGERKEGEAI